MIILLLSFLLCQHMMAADQADFSTQDEIRATQSRFTRILIEKVRMTQDDVRCVYALATGMAVSAVGMALVVLIENLEDYYCRS